MLGDKKKKENRLQSTWVKNCFSAEQFHKGVEQQRLELSFSISNIEWCYLQK